MVSEENRKRAFILVIIALIVVALVITVFAPNALAQSDIGTNYPKLQNSIDQCNTQIASMETLLITAKEKCEISNERVNRLSDGFKYYTASALAVSVALNATLIYYLLRKKREPTTPLKQEVKELG